jgi:hypothetical protein
LINQSNENSKNQKPFPLNLTILEIITKKVDIEICRYCPFVKIMKRRYNKPSDGYCPILRSFYLDKLPILTDTEEIYYPYENRKVLSDDSNGARFSDIPFDCPYNFSRIEDV